MSFLYLVEVTGLEPTASASRTRRSTKLSHTSKIFMIIIIIHIFGILARDFFEIVSKK